MTANEDPGIANVRELLAPSPNGRLEWAEVDAATLRKLLSAFDAIAQRDAEIEHLRGSESLLSKTVTSLQEQVDERDAEIARLRKALAFAACCIKSGEPWTETCEAEIGGALRGAKEAQRDA